MSHRPTGTPVGQDASKSRLKAVLATGLAHHWRRGSVPVEALKRAREEIPPNLLTALPRELLEIILSYSKGMPCQKIRELRLIDQSFDQLLQGGDFWQWQCELRDYDREDRLFPNRDPLTAYWGAPVSGSAKVPYTGSYRKHYEWWCERQFDNRLLRIAVDGLFGRSNAAAKPPPYIDLNAGPIASWDVSQVTDMSGLFKDNDSFNADLSLWNVSKVTNMNNMFEKATSFNSDLTKWKVGKVNRMLSMFGSAKQFNNGSARGVANNGLKDWDVGMVQEMRDMFREAEGFNSNIGGWNVMGTYSMESMFEGATSFNCGQAPGVRHDLLVSWNVMNVIHMQRMFAGATCFNGNLSTWTLSDLAMVYDTDMFANATRYNPPDGFSIGEKASEKAKVIAEARVEAHTKIIMLRQLEEEAVLIAAMKEGR